VQGPEDAPLHGLMQAYIAHKKVESALRNTTKCFRDFKFPSQGHMNSIQKLINLVESLWGTLLMK